MSRLLILPALLLPALLLAVQGYLSITYAGEPTMSDASGGLSSPSQLEQARLLKQGSYKVRTRFMDDGEPRYTNRLILENSPYLLQHAHNPVNWYAWGEEAFAEARRQNKPVFLSIGYSTCHWCHVMEEESFDNEQVAELLNRHFIAIKVDREQRPDIDEIYMTGVQLLTGGGGWPMSNFLTPEGKPFFGGTYFPREQFIRLLQQVQQAWSDKRAGLRDNAEKIYAAIEQQLQLQGRAATVGQQQIEQAVAQLLAAEDKVHGGFHGAPKFPNESYLLLLIDQLERSNTATREDPRRQALERALDGMLQGGIYDQIGGGFHRYATDAAWLVPHFEKMLYNQAQLARVYARAWALTGNTEYRRIAEETLDYVLREMRADAGGFYSATDADSEGEEGKYFVWDWTELTRVLSPSQLALSRQVYGAGPAGNFEGHNILHLPAAGDRPAATAPYSPQGLATELAALKRTLYQRRQTRVPPLRDDKIITHWNGLMITALAEAGQLLGRTDYVTAAGQAANFIWGKRTPAGLYRIDLDGHSSVAAGLEDYSAYLQGLLALYDASADPLWSERAVALHSDMVERLWNAADGGFYNSQQHRGGPMLLRSQAATDGATASGNSLALGALVALHQRRPTPQLQAQIAQQIARYSAAMKTSPLALSAMLIGLAESSSPAPRALQYAGGGHVRVAATRQPGALVITLSIDEGWHVNAADSGIEELIDTRLRVDSPGALATHYPPGDERTLSFSSVPLVIYQGEVKISAELSNDVSPVRASLQLQTCSDTLCLQAQTLRLVLR